MENNKIEVSQEIVVKIRGSRYSLTKEEADSLYAQLLPICGEKVFSMPKPPPYTWSPNTWGGSWSPSGYSSSDTKLT